MFHNKHWFSQWGAVSPSPNPQAGGPPFVGCLRLLIQYFCSYPPYWRLFLHPQPEEAPCCGDGPTYNMDTISYMKYFYKMINDTWNKYWKNLRQKSQQLWCLKQHRFNVSSHHVDHMRSIMAIGNNFWQMEKINTEYCTNLNSNKLRYRKQKKFPLNEDYTLN
jgi:hypothetical protein